MMQLHSASLRPGQPIPLRHTLYGENLSPPLTWTDVPPRARSLLLLIEDRDASGRDGQPFTHWIVYNLQPSSSGLELGANRDGLPAGCQQGINDFGRSEYDGPRPPAGVHRYVLRLMALDDTLDARALGAAGRREVLAAADAYVLAEARLEATYEHSMETRPQM